MLTLCWSAKGGSGATVVAAGIALAAPTPTLLVDLAGGLPVALGLTEPAGPGVADWLAANAAAARLTSLELALTRSVSLLPGGRDARALPTEHARWRQLAEQLAGEPRHVVVDAGTDPLPAALVGAATR